MRLEPNNMWLHLAMAEGEELREQTASTNIVNTPAVLGHINKHQPCTAIEVSATTGISLTSVAAIIGTGVRAKRIKFELRKVKGMRRAVKFYSEVTE